MKSTKDIIGLRIISIADGTQVGVVKDLVLNPQGKSLDFIIVDQPTDYLGAKVVAFADISGLGEFAITIPHPGVIQDVAQNAEAQRLLKQDTRVLGTKVLTKKGQLIGSVKEILIDEETGLIKVCVIESEGQMREIGVEQIITLGKELLIIEEELTSPNDQILELRAEAVGQDPVLTSGFLHEHDFTSPEDTVDGLLSEKKLEFSEEREGFNLFEQRQLQFFIGKTVEKDIVLDNGEVLHAGEFITSDMVDHVATRSTLMEVTSHLQKN